MTDIKARSTFPKFDCFCESPFPPAFCVTNDTFFRTFRVFLNKQVDSQPRNVVFTSEKSLFTLSIHNFLNSHSFRFCPASVQCKNTELRFRALATTGTGHVSVLLVRGMGRLGSLGNAVKAFLSGKNWDALPSRNAQSSLFSLVCDYAPPLHISTEPHIFY